MGFGKKVVMAGAVAVVGVAMSTPAMAAGGGGMVSMPVLAAATLPMWVFHAFDWLVISLLIFASISGIALAIDAMLHVREIKIAPPETTEHLRSLIAGRQFKELMDFTATDETFISKGLYAAIRKAHLKFPAMREAMENSLGEQSSHLFRRLEPMNVIGNIGPLLGLLGTVLGMIMAFYALLATGGNAKPADLAGGIGAALWHTFFGLFVAIPCLVVYGLYRTKADKIVTKASVVAEELLEGLRPESSDEASKSKKVSSSSSKATAAAPAPQPVPQPAE
ncbi:MAG: MotA/TolQ/ExbB proton channel family protein [Phycisphaerales bacterium]|nr:MotA/TolQ/ExbB proton channel family protein [Phycisphaerales bacterium]